MVIQKLYRRFLKLINRKHLYILCASDRFNYGDLIYPYIIREYLKDTVCEIFNCATTQSDLSDLGALATYGYDKLVSMSAFYHNTLIVGGGECVFCNWNDILGYVSDEAVAHSMRPTRYPFTIEKSELPHLDFLCYNSVGCNVLNATPELYESAENKSILQSADFISVRDGQTSLGMSRMNLKHHRKADSAILMSRVFSREYILQHMRPEVRNVAQQRYMFFQIGLQHLKEWENDFAEILSNIHREKNIHICMCPIGTAPGHDDPEAIARIARHLPDGLFTIVSDPSLWDIMGLIMQSEIYVGSSLHGAITAMSFDRPLIAFGPRKLQVYIETWYDTIGSEYSFVSIENLERAVKRRIDTHFTISNAEQMTTAEESLMMIYKKVKG